MKVVCRTNLDLCGCERFPEDLPAVPCVGDLIESKHEWPGGCHLRLKVCQITWMYAGAWYPEIEMTIPRLHSDLRSFFEWYGRVTGRGVHAFI